MPKTVRRMMSPRGALGGDDQVTSTTEHLKNLDLSALQMSKEDVDKIVAEARDQEPEMVKAVEDICSDVRTFLTLSLRKKTCAVIR